MASSWQLLSASLNPTSITCHDASHCWAPIGNGVVVLGPGGKRTVVELPASDGTVASVACPTDTDCFAVGSQSGKASALHSTDGGFSWVPETVPTGTSGLGQVSCAPGTSDCWAVGGATIVATFNGGAWVAEQTPNIGNFNSISCPTSNACLAVAGNQDVSTVDGGTRWQRGAQLPAALIWNESLDCAGSSVCYVVGSRQNSLSSQTGFVYRTSDAGASWTVLPFPTALPAYGAYYVSCWSPTACLADGTINNGGIEGSSGTPFVIATTDGGASWTERAAPKSVVQEPALACLSADLCWLAGPSGIGTTTDLAASWQPALPPKGFAITTVSCPAGAARACRFSGTTLYPESCHIAIGLSCGKVGPFVLSGTQPGGIVATLTSTGWSYDAADQQLTAVSSMSCAAAADCLLVATQGSNPILVGLSGSSYRQVALPQNLAPDLDKSGVISCWASGDCVVTGTSSGHPVLLEERGGSWSASAAPAGFQTLTGVACAGASRCVAVGTSVAGGHPLAMVGHGTSWATLSLPSQVVSVSAVGCASASTCWIGALLTGSKPAMLRSTSLPRTDQTAWNIEALPPEVTSISSISCASTDDCRAVGALANGGSLVLGAGTAPSGLAWQVSGAAA